MNNGRIVLLILLSCACKPILALSDRESLKSFLQQYREDNRKLEAEHIYLKDYAKELRRSQIQKSYTTELDNYSENLPKYLEFCQANISEDPYSAAVKRYIGRITRHLIRTITSRAKRKGGMAGQILAIDLTS